MNASKETQEDNRYTDIPFDTVVKAFKKSACNMTLTAEQLNISRRTLSRWREKYPELNNEMKEAEEGLLDLSETKLMQAINEGNLTAIIFYLKTKGKSRGYIEGQFIAGNISTNKSMSQEEALAFLKSLDSEY